MFDEVVCVCVFWSNPHSTVVPSGKEYLLSTDEHNEYTQDGDFPRVSQWVSGEAGLLHSQTSLLFRLYSAEFLWTTNGKIEN